MRVFSSVTIVRHLGRPALLCITWFSTLEISEIRLASWATWNSLLFRYTSACCCNFCVESSHQLRNSHILVYSTIMKTGGKHRLTKVAMFHIWKYCFVLAIFSERISHISLRCGYQINSSIQWLMKHNNLLIFKSLLDYLIHSCSWMQCPLIWHNSTNRTSSVARIPE